MEGHLSLIQKDSAAHMHSLANSVVRVPFAQNYLYKTTEDSYYFFLYQSVFSFCMAFDAISYFI